MILFKKADNAESSTIGGNTMQKAKALILSRGTLLRERGVTYGRELIVLKLARDLVQVGILDLTRQIVAREYWSYSTLKDGYRPVSSNRH